MNLMGQLQQLQIPGPYVNRGNIIHTKMVNMSRSCGIQVNYQNLPNIESFLTNFNQLVLQSGIIQKFCFCFDLPLSLLTKDLTAQDLLHKSDEKNNFSTENIVSPFSQILKNSIFTGPLGFEAGGSSEKKASQAQAQPTINILEEIKRM